jgi:hypothetical protein
VFVQFVESVGATDDITTFFVTDQFLAFADAIGISDEVVAQVLRIGDNWFGTPSITESLETLVPRIVGVKKDE